MNFDPEELRKLLPELIRELHRAMDSGLVMMSTEEFDGMGLPRAIMGITNPMGPPLRLTLALTYDDTNEGIKLEEVYRGKLN